MKNKQELEELIKETEKACNAAEESYLPYTLIPVTQLNAKGLTLLDGSNAKELCKNTSNKLFQLKQILAELPNCCSNEFNDQLKEIANKNPDLRQFIILNNLIEGAYEK